MDAVEKLRQIREDLEMRRSTAPDYATKNDYFVSDIYLQDLESYLQKAVEHSLRKVSSKMFTTQQTGEPILRELRVPTLFINDNPVLLLFIFNILRRLTRSEITLFLESKGCTEFEVTCVKCKKNSSSAIVKCGNLASSTKMQVLACKKELEYVYPNGKSSYFKTRPEQNCFTTNISIDNNRIATFDPTVLPDNLKKLMYCTPVVRILLKMLNADDFFNFYYACHNCPILHGFSTAFKSSLKRYQNAQGVVLMVKDSKTFSFDRFEFKGHTNPIEPHTVSAMLHNTYKKAAPIESNVQHCKIIELNLTDINATNALIAKISSNFSVQNLTLGKTKYKAEEKVTFADLKQLTIVNNDEFYFKNFTLETFPVLTVLKIHNCKCINISRVLAYVMRSETLKELCLVDCQFIDRYPNDILEAVMSGENNIESFYYMFSPNFLPTAIQMSRPNVKLSQHIKKINLNFNMHFKECINTILDKLPCLEDLHLLGLDFSQVINIKTSLKTLELSNFRLLNVTLNNLDVRNLSTLRIENTLGKKKTKALDLNFIIKAFRVNKKLELEFVRCKFIQFNDIVRQCNKRNIIITQNLQTTTFHYII